ncbi:zeta toxin family protein [Nocardia pseudovaccinii]|uniref:zeta toxin family protein n=1 Tax=Nocardia pseudovaccinii TaxID=189540 RepID=UPI0007A429AD
MTRPQAAPFTVVLFDRIEDSRKGPIEAARIVRLLNAKGLDVGLTVRGAPPECVWSARQLLSSVAERHVDVKPFTVDRDEILADIRSADLVVMPSGVKHFGLVGLDALGSGTPLLVPRASGIGHYLGNPAFFPSDLTEPSLVDQDPGGPVALDLWADRIAELIGARSETSARAVELQRRFYLRNSTPEGAAESIADFHRAADALIGKKLIHPGADDPGTDWDDALYYEAAVDIISSLIAACSANEWLSEHGGPADLVTSGDTHGSRRTYLAHLGGLATADHALIASTIRTCGGRLADLGAGLGSRRRPDLDSYRLSRGEHRWVFERKIVPELFSGLQSRNRPTAIIVAGAPGSGKTTAIRKLWEGRADRDGVAVIDPELLSAYHPRSWDLVLADDRRVTDLVMWDAMGWTALAVEYAIGQRADVLLETGPDDAHNFAAAFRESGYRVEMDIMAIPGSISRLHSTVRYHCKRGNWQVLTLPDPHSNREGA